MSWVDELAAIATNSVCHTRLHEESSYLLVGVLASPRPEIGIKVSAGEELEREVFGRPRYCGE
jgi:hypothetical protein